MNLIIKIDRELSDFDRELSDYDRVLVVCLLKVYKINCQLEYMLLSTGFLFERLYFKG